LIAIVIRLGTRAAGYPACSDWNRDLHRLHPGDDRWPDWTFAVL